MSAAIERLGQLGILTSEDVGKIVYAFVDAGHMQIAPDDSQDDFAGLFTIDNFHQVRLT
jgi:uncharacterized repeat protein (TIGR04138 family)